VVDLSDFGSSVAVHTTGQSGHAYHPNYFDMNPNWVEGTTLLMPWGEIEGDRLLLKPE
jgi:penicillin amidase